MQTILLLVAVLVVLLVLRPVLRVLIAAIAGRSVAEKALAKIPDHVHLVPAATDVWADDAGARRLASQLAKRGFEDGGTYTVDEMKGVTLELMAHRLESIFAVIYEHPVAGQWIEMVTRYTDQTSFRVTSSRDPGLNERPGHRCMHLPGATPDMLHKRLISGRPEGTAEPIDMSGLQALFESGYAESVAWRKSQGISRGEVVKVATRKVA